VTVRVTVLTEVPDELSFRGIEPPEFAHGFVIALDTAEPWGGGRFEGRVERRARGRSASPLVVAVRCGAAWLDVAPQLVGKKRLLSITTYWDLRSRGVPIWLDEEVFVEKRDVGALADANWLSFDFTIPRRLPRSFEGTFVSFRWRVEAVRRGRVRRERASIPVLVREPQTEPVVRIESSPLGSWRLLEWKAEADLDSAAGPCAVAYESRRPEDVPLPGETRESELRRRAAG
jgi:hypothetical protein